MRSPTMASLAAVAASLCLFATPTMPGFAAAGNATARSAAPASAAPASAPDAASAFEKLKALAGKWEGKDSKGNVTPVTYTVIANGSGVMEEMGGEGHGDMVTVYHRDGERLMLTHYCMADNQPRMRLRSASADGKTLTFELVDVTNLKKPSDGHMRALGVTFIDPDHFSQQWTFREAGKDQPEQFTYARVN